MKSIYKNLLTFMVTFSMSFLTLTSWSQISNPPVIDGLGDDASWASTSWQNITRNIAYGDSITSPADFTSKFKLLWDAKNFYLLLTVLDDTLTDYHMYSWDKSSIDGAEVYFDLDNSKNILQPRNANWQKTSYDKNDFQYQLWLGKNGTSATAKKSALTTYKVDTTHVNGVAVGYTMECTFSIDTLVSNDPNFSATLGANSVIGFDINMSDNDYRYKNRPYIRKEISFNMTSEQAYHDAVYIGAVKLLADGQVEPVWDLTPPSAPATLSLLEAYLNGGKIVWSKSTDNILAETYRIFRNDTLIQTVLRDTTATVTILKQSDILTVKAVDINTNVSDASPSLQINPASVLNVTIDGKVDPAYDITPWMDIKTKVAFADSIKSPNDFSAKFKLLWDPKNIYLYLNVVDDTLTDYHMFSWDKSSIDGAEVYFDLDNSKNILQPRNANWQKTSYDKNDFQYQLWLGKNGISATAKKGALVGYKADTVFNASHVAIGYTMECQFSLDTLKSNDPAFSTVLGDNSIIGFDINMSDNDYKFKGRPYIRKEVSWNTSSEQVYHDAVYMGAVKLQANGGILSARDITPPTAPSTVNLLEAYLNGGKISWSKASDNILVEQYNIYRNDTLITPTAILRDTVATVKVFKTTDNITVKSLDINGNLSAKSAALQIALPSTLNVIIDGQVDPAYDLTPWMDIKTKVAYGDSVVNAADFSAKFKLIWDPKNIYLYLNVVDDTLTDYHKYSWDKSSIDGAEVYFDLDNSKNVLQPRDANWQKTSYDKNDFQYQLWLGKNGISATSKKGALVGYKADTVFNASRVAIGYNMECQFSLDTLKSNDPAFATNLGGNSIIGFDINMSDNDFGYKGRSYIRKEISWNTSSEQVYHDAVYMGSVKLLENGGILSARDVTPPSTPIILVKDSTVNPSIFTWAQSTDNILVESYAVYRNDSLITTVLRDTTVKILVPKGSDKISIKALDINGNYSAKSNDVQILDPAEPLAVASVKSQNNISVFPNPASTFVRIDGGNEKLGLIRISDLSGRVILSKKENSATAIIGLEGLNTGVYLILVNQPNGNKTVSKIVVRK
jgi:hypothetical protein